ncbi:hypothetical protein J5N97_014366 [Dioscorea zingiberensis]|uniref:Aminotransferase-like plant mobile domain-containing protein n=1 Tax=Dioscorea zingiberensis TaxID=325984 RepID=A0A9D5CTT4_9LILI|nr:hypothetical protein J5N97_014366 [Dioscorea zingiberensis]
MGGAALFVRNMEFPTIPPPGPDDASVLTNQSDHRSEHIYMGDDPGIVKIIDHTSRGISAPARIHDILQRSGFFWGIKVPAVRLDHALLNAFIERWRPETNTFHLRVGEMTITLKDVAILTGLRIDGDPVICEDPDNYEQLCAKTLGTVPLDAKSGKVKLESLREICEHAEDNECCARSFILYTIGSRLFPDSTGNKVSLRWLTLCADLDRCGHFAWGAAVLSYLYGQLSKATSPSREQCAGFFTLLQIWIWEYFPALAPVKFMSENALPLDYPYGARWSIGLNFQHQLRSSNVSVYRNELDVQHAETVVWKPYKKELIRRLPQICTESKDIWMARVPLICMDYAEMHLPDRVMRQFGLIQHIPENVLRPRRYGRYRPMASLLRLRETELQRWAARRTSIVQQSRGLAHRREQALQHYISWYWSITRRYVSTPTMPANPSIYTPRGFVETAMLNFMVNASDLAAIADSDVVLDAVVYRDRLRDIRRYYQQVISALPFHVIPDKYHPDPTSLGQVPRRGRRRRQASRLHDDEAGPSTTADDMPDQIEPVSQLTQLEDRGRRRMRRGTQRT